MSDPDASAGRDAGATARSAALRHRAAGMVGRALLDTLFATVRYQECNGAWVAQRMRENRPILFLLWHGRLLPLAHYHRGRHYVTMISQSADGEYIARIVEGWNYGIVRGSSSRGGSTGLRELIRHLRAGRSLAITPDGPRGPFQRMKPGALLAAQMTGTPVLPVAAGIDRTWSFGKWDRFLVPRPFARIMIRYDEPFEIPRDTDAAGLERISVETEKALTRVTAQADADVGA
ncbi:MAG: lysophospholipid acyltransferase family protein [Longimicrobiales bacterium]